MDAREQVEPSVSHDDHGLAQAECPWRTFRPEQESKGFSARCHWRHARQCMSGQSPRATQLRQVPADQSPRDSEMLQNVHLGRGQGCHRPDPAVCRGPLRQPTNVFIMTPIAGVAAPLMKVSMRAVLWSGDHAIG